jgi:hypothetical protein
MRTKVDVAAEVAGIASLSRDELATRWQQTYGLYPTSGVRTDLLVRYAAWHLQVKRLGGFTAETRRLLRSGMAEIEAKAIDRSRKRHSAETDRGKGNTAPTVEGGAANGGQSEGKAAPGKRERRKLAPGARLMREWNGRTHVVDVVENGFVFGADVYPSLTAIAQTITGAHWSGPRFFGL